MSGSVSYLDLGQIARGSDAVLLVRKIEPHIVHREEPVGGAPVRMFTFTSYRFAVKSVIHSRLDHGISMDTLEVQDASNEDNFRNEKRFLAGKPTRNLIYESYRPHTEQVDSLSEFLIFVKYDGNSERFTFIAHNASEGAALIPKVREILSASREPPSR